MSRQLRIPEAQKVPEANHIAARARHSAVNAGPSVNADCNPFGGSICFTLQAGRPVSFPVWAWYSARLSACPPGHAAEASSPAATPVTVHAQGQGSPGLFLRDGHKLVTSYAGDTAAIQALRGSQTRPLAMASADFDEDGTPDLVSSYATGSGTGALAVHRGNVDALWPYGAALRNGEPPAFLSAARVFAVPGTPDFLAAGDFDADGHQDIVSASLGGSTLYLLRGDGHGGFAPAQPIDLPGTVTAFTAGEMNRADGLTDLAVGIDTGDGFQVLVFESPAGALRGKAEVFPASAAVNALAMMPLDDDHFNDLAVGAGSELMVIHGRDRMLSHPKSVRDSVPPATITRQTLPFQVRALTAGRFTSATLQDLAALGDDTKIHFLERPDAEYQAARAQAPVSMASRNGHPFGPARAGTFDTRVLPRKPEGHELTLRSELALPATPDSASRLITAHTSIAGGDDAILVDASSNQLHVISRASGQPGKMRLAASLAATGAPSAVLPMRLNPSALHGLVVLQKDQLEPSIPSSPHCRYVHRHQHAR